MNFQTLLAKTSAKLKKTRKSARRKAPLGLINKYYLNFENNKLRQKLESMAVEMTKKEYQDLNRRTEVLNVCRTTISNKFIEHALSIDCDFILSEQNEIHVYGILAGKIRGSNMIEVELLCSVDTQKRIGSHLLDLVKQLAPIITLHPVKSAIAFYEKQGFVMDTTSNHMYYPSWVVEKISRRFVPSLQSQSKPSSSSSSSSKPSASSSSIPSKFPSKFQSKYPSKIPSKSMMMKTKKRKYSYTDSDSDSDSDSENRPSPLWKKPLNYIYS